jgi:HIV Tat-specific factor 1
MDGRFFANKRVEAYIADGNERFKKSSERKDVNFKGNGNGNDEAGDADEEGKRLDRFGEWLEGGAGG